MRSDRKLSGDRCMCPTCGEYFNRTSVFDRHRIGKLGEKRCLTIAQMDSGGFRKNLHGYWVRKIAASRRPPNWRIGSFGGGSEV